jgi:uncharacterized peroxidase-related enzyme
MTRIKAISPEHATSETKELFGAVKTKMGMIPNLMKTMGHSPALLEGYLNYNDALANGVLDKQLRELIAVTVGEYNGCQYCVSAHNMIGKKMAGISPEIILAARAGNATSTKFDGALTFVRAILAQKGSVSDHELHEVKVAGYSDEEVAEIIGHVALNMLTNYFNNTAKTEVDFPKVELLEKFEPVNN